MGIQKQDSEMLSDISVDLCDQKQKKWVLQKHDFEILRDISVNLCERKQKKWVFENRIVKN